VTGGLSLLVIGGYGTFGGRIVALLEDEPRLTLIVAGRSLEKARAYCRSRGKAQARLVPAAFDRDGDVGMQVRVLRPNILVDASGPFQTYGDRPYRLIEACLAAGVNYLDLADGSDFVAGVEAFDGAARAAGCYVLSGASSFPVLTAAVVRRLSSDMARVDSIRAGIAPSPYAGVGGNVIRAIAGYAGQRIALVRGAEAASGHPFTEHRRFTIAPPGRLPLHSTLFSLVDVPESRVLPTLWPETREIWIGAGPVPEILHRALIGLAWLVRAGWLPTLSPLAPLMHWATNHLRWGEHRGGMFVAVIGAGRSGAWLERSWHLLAEGDDGPLIPSMAVEALVRRTLNGSVPRPGSRAAARDLELEDYEMLFRRRRIYTGVRDDTSPARGPLYARVMATAWDDLPVELRRIHDVEHDVSAQGRATIERGRRLLARLAAAVISFPRAAADVRVAVRFQVSDGVETWTRTFGNETFSSRQFAGDGRSERLLCERFGPLDLRHGAGSGGHAAVADPAPLERLRHAAPALALPALELIRDRRARPLPLSCRDRPSAARPHRPLPRMARSRRGP
jgi:hypothetical protein